MPASESQRDNFKRNHGIDLTDSELQELNKEITKKTTGPGICILVAVVVLLFIVIGMVTDELSMDVYTFVPFGIILCIIVSSADSLKKTTTRIEREFASRIKASRGIPMTSAQPANVPAGSAFYSTSLPPQAVQVGGGMKVCSMCGAQNPFTSRFCNNCASQFPAPAQSPAPVAEKIIMKEVVREIVKIRCSHCGTLVENTLSECHVCGARL